MPNTTFNPPDVQMLTVQSVFASWSRIGIATQHVKKEAELPVVQHALGHGDLATTSRYVGLVREQMDKRLEENALEDGP